MRTERSTSPTSNAADQPIDVTLTGTALAFDIPIGPFATDKTFTYNVDGTLASVTSTNGDSRVFTYDTDGVLTQVDATTNSTTIRKTFAYDTDGVLTSITEVVL